MAAEFVQDFRPYDVGIPRVRQYAVAMVNGRAQCCELPAVLGPASNNRMVVVGVWEHDGWVVGLEPSTRQWVIVTPFKEAPLWRELHVSVPVPEWSVEFGTELANLCGLISSYLGAHGACDRASNSLLFQWAEFGPDVARQDFLGRIDSLNEAIERAAEEIISKLERLLEFDEFDKVSHEPDDTAHG